MATEPNVDNLRERIEALAINDLGTPVVEKLREDVKRIEKTPGSLLLAALLEEKAERLKEKAERLMKEGELLKEKAMRDGTYLEDCDGLWSFSKGRLPQKKQKQMKLFGKIARKTCPNCYNDFENEFVSDLRKHSEPAGSLKSKSSSFSIKGTKDIFNNEWNNERAHLVPGSSVCAPKWGHSCEGAFRPIQADDLNQARKLLVMGSKGSSKFRSLPQNFIKFAAHKELFDVDPSVIIIPILTLEEVRDGWISTNPYDALVIASKAKKRDREELYSAASAYKEMLSHFEYQDGNYCSPEEIKAATEILRHFVLGHAGSLAAGIPFAIDSDESTEEKRTVLKDLKSVQEVILNHGIDLPCLRTGTVLRKVLKIRFCGKDGEPIPDPWLLAAKAAVNLSSTRGQKLLPACSKPEEEDVEVLQGLYEYQRKFRVANLPAEVNFSLGETPNPPETPPQSSGAVVAVVTPPRGTEGDWENLED